MTKQRKIGLVVPYSTDEVPRECRLMYPNVGFVPRGVGVQQLTHAGYEEATARVMPAVLELAKEDVDAIMLIGTSLTFYRGAAFNAELIKRISAATGLPASTMSSAVVDGLRAIGGRRIVVATAYSDEVNGYLRNYLTEVGLEVLAMEGFGLIGFADPHSKSEADIVELSAKVYDKARGADALLISCGGLNTLKITRDLEEQLGIPIVSSMPAGIWAAVRLAGESGFLAGHGRLFEQSGQ